MNRTINQLAGEIVSLSVLISLNTKADVFVEYAAHVGWIAIRFCKNGWQSKGISTTISLNTEREEKAIKELLSVKKQLIQFGIKNKLDYSKLPYEIEEIKHYKFA